MRIAIFSILLLIAGFACYRKMNGFRTTQTGAEKSLQRGNQESGPNGTNHNDLIVWGEVIFRDIDRYANLQQGD